METSFSQLVQKYDYFLLDCDGVLWSGEHQIGNAFQTVEWLESQGKKVFFISNSSGKTREQMVQKMQKFGYSNARIDQMYGSAYFSAHFIRENYPNVKKAWVVGMNSIRKELEQVGISSIGGEDYQNLGVTDNATLFGFPEFIKTDKDVDSVIVGLDTSFTHVKNLLTNLYLQKAPIPFFATNDDAYDIVNGRHLPGAGAIVAAILFGLNNIEGSQRTSPTVVIGKPNPFVVSLIMREHNIDPLDKKKILMIGDRLDTDILLGRNAGIDSCVVLTGVSRNMSQVFEEVQARPELAPTYWKPSFFEGNLK